MSKRKRAKSSTPRPTQTRQKPKRPQLKPRILILEALSGGSRCVAAAGGVGLPFTPNGSASTLDMITKGEWDALLLTGGVDIDPRIYGEKKIHKTVYGINEIRDRVEQVALGVARRRQVPVLGICRGAQMMAAESGGKLYQHIGRRHQNSTHWVRSRAGSVLEQAAGSEFLVVSLHHQAVRFAAPGWRISGRALDGTAEAVESDDGRCLGVQFHPEMDSHEDYARGIFRWFVLEAAKQAGKPVPEWPPKPKRSFGFSYSTKGVSHQVGWDDDEYWTCESASQTTEPGSAIVPKEPFPALPAPKHRSAGVPTVPKNSNPVTYRYFCRCHGIEFDKMVDRDDHERTFATVKPNVKPKPQSDGEQNGKAA